MITFIIGASGTGKSTLARDIAKKTRGNVVSAGRWVRAMLPADPRLVAPPSPEDLQHTTLTALWEDPLRSARWIEEQLRPYGHDGVVEGIRNPTDLLYLARPKDHVVDLGGIGTYPWERSGLAAVRACREHLAFLGVTWTDYHRTLARLPTPLPAHVESRLLYQDQRPGTEPGEILALESYVGASVTALWRSASGGMFHDLPLDAFVLDGDLSPDDALEMRRGGEYDPLHGIPAAPWSAGPGSPVVEAPPTEDPVVVFRPNRSPAGPGRLLWTVHWPDGNVLYHLVEVAQGLRLWPPHKMMIGAHAAGLVEFPELPKWRKRREGGA